MRGMNTKKRSKPAVAQVDKNCCSMHGRLNTIKRKTSAFCTQQGLFFNLNQAEMF